MNMFLFHSTYRFYIVIICYYLVAALKHTLSLKHVLWSDHGSKNALFEMRRCIEIRLSPYCLHWLLDSFLQSDCGFLLFKHQQCQNWSAWVLGRREQGMQHGYGCVCVFNEHAPLHHTPPCLTSLLHPWGVIDSNKQTNKHLRKTEHVHESHCRLWS